MQEVFITTKSKPITYGEKMHDLLELNRDTHTA